MWLISLIRDTMWMSLTLVTMADKLSFRLRSQFEKYRFVKLQDQKIVLKLNINSLYRGLK
jgi:hypothetical protein